MNELDARRRDPPSAPQVRTLLLTDLCDSTLLVERLGDGARRRAVPRARPPGAANCSNAGAAA